MTNLVQRSSGGFADAFFAELLAGLIILVIGSYAIPRYLDYRKRPQLKFINPNDRSEAFLLTKSTNGFWEAMLDLVIKNEGETTQKKWFWHLIVPLDLQPQLISLDHTTTAQHNEILINGRRWRHYFASSIQRKDVVYAKRGLRFNYQLKVKTSD